jgi:rSAM/selenodomain-associated transferase 1
MRQALAVAAKAPQRGAVKTRLHQVLSADDATELYCCFLQDTVALMRRVPSADLFISYTPEGSEGLFRPLICDGEHLILQRGENFGERLFYTLEDLFDRGYEAAMVMDADSPTLPSSYVARGFEMLARPGDRVVLGPAADGGYYLIGVKRPHRQLFERINWSSETVLEETLDRAREIDLEACLLPEWFDVDDVVSFRRLCNDVLKESSNGNRAVHTRRFILSRRPGDPLNEDNEA